MNSDIKLKKGSQELPTKQSFMSWQALSNDTLRSKIGFVAEKLLKFIKFTKIYETNYLENKIEEK